jgi:small neutral amino acid transporter SnatA (MarC family)
LPVGITGQVIVYGLIAALSPVALLTTLAVLSTRRGRANGAAYGIAFLIGQTLALVVVLLVGSVTIHDRGDDVVSASFELAAGVLLILLSFGRRTRPAAPPREVGGRTGALLERLADLTPRTAFGVGLPMGIGVKRLVVTVLAASTISIADPGQEEAVRLGAIYVSVACVLVALPVVVYLIAGARADEWVSDSKAWLASNQSRLTGIALLAFGALFVADGVVELVRAT